MRVRISLGSKEPSEACLIGRMLLAHSRSVWSRRHLPRCCHDSTERIPRFGRHFRKIQFLDSAGVSWPKATRFTNLLPLSSDAVVAEHRSLTSQSLRFVSGWLGELGHTKDEGSPSRRALPQPIANDNEVLDLLRRMAAGTGMSNADRRSVRKRHQC